jgi:hypothetical protein
VYKSFLSLFYILLTLFSATVNAAEFVNPTGGRAINHDPGHKGVDLYSQPNEEFFFPVPTEVIRIEKDQISNWEGLSLRGKNQYAKYSFRILGIKPSVKLNQQLSEIEILGLTQDPAKEFKGIKPYVHFEVYENGALINPTEIAKKLFPKRPTINAGIESGYNFPFYSYLDEGKEYESKGELNKAKESYISALKFPLWEIAPNGAMQSLANCYAELSDFQNAVRVQEMLIDSLKLQKNYSLGSIPSPKLGVIAAVNSEESLNILIAAHEANLSAYKSNEKTLVRY